ncbi:MAG: efflux RND transporter permease subunit [Gemmatimonadetes bacterium]|nr:efflux RND transporter permease subunit [Gemmatimonadota bacterium]
MIKLAIKRPVAVSMGYVAVALLGVAAWRNIPIELMPETALPQLTVTARWTGASPEATEAFVTSPLEAVIQQVRGVDKIRSRSEEQQGRGVAQITVEFDRDTDMDFARLELSERLAVLEEELPVGVDGPEVQPYIPEEFDDQYSPLLVYTLTAPFTLEALRAHLDDVVAPEVLQVEGVATVDAFGGRDRLLELEFDQNELRALGLTAAIVRQRVLEIEQVSEAGAVFKGGMLRTLSIRQRAETIDEVRNLIVLSDRGRLVRLSDIATVRDTYEDYTFHYRVDGMPAVQFRVIKEHATNSVEVADRVKARLAGIEQMHPPGTRLILDDDESEEIRTQLTDLRERAIVAALVIFSVLLLFLQSFRSAAIIFATIAFSVLIALNLIYFSGYTLNVLTLMGLAMGFGLIVDNAIVVLENVYRRKRAGDDPEVAAFKGAREVVLPILAATLTTLIVFIPFVYLQGELRIFYVPLAVVVGMSLLASLFVAFTFIPSLAARILGGISADADGAAARQPIYVRAYGSMVGLTTRHPWFTIVIALGAFYGSWHLFDKYVTRGIIWGGFFSGASYIDIRISLPRGQELERTDELARFFEAKLLQTPEIEKFVTQVYEQRANIRVTFPESIEQTQIPVAIKEQMVAYSYQFGGVDVRVYGYGPSFYGGGGSPPNYTIRIFGYNYERVREISEDMKLRLERFSRVREVDTNAGGRWWGSEKASEVVVQLDRERLAMHELTVREVVSQVRAAVGGRTSPGQIRIGGEELGFEVKMEGYRDLDVLELAETLITSSDGDVRLADIAVITERDVLNVIEREDQQYQRSVRYEFRGPRKLGDRYRDAVIASTDLPDGYRIEGQQTWSWSDDERTQVYILLGVSLVLVFMVTAALFESLRQPICVLLTVPMALIGVFLIFFYTGASFTREAYIGVIMMGGIVVNNAILLVDHVNQLRRIHGIQLMEAVVRGTLERVRPILMTSATTVLGLLPLVLFSDYADANIWNALGFALIGGLLSSTLFVLTVTPALYVLFEKGPEKRRVASAVAETITASPMPAVS